MQKSITVCPQTQLKPFFKKLLRPVASLIITTLETAEKFDAQFFTEEDTWQMRVVFYSFYFVAIPLFMILYKIYLG